MMQLLAQSNQIDVLTRQVKYCELCRSLLNKKSVCLTLGKNACEGCLLFVGQNPGPKEVIEGKAFVGSAGSNFNSIFLRGADIDREDIAISNCVKCYTDDFRVTGTMVENCFLHLANEINFVKPRLIIAMGLPAIKSLTGLSLTLSEAHGSFYKCIIHGYKVFCTYHPMSIGYNPELRSKVVVDMITLKEYLYNA